MRKRSTVVESATIIEEMPDNNDNTGVAQLNRAMPTAF